MVDFTKCIEREGSKCHFFYEGLKFPTKGNCSFKIKEVVLFVSFQKCDERDHSMIL